MFLIQALNRLAASTALQISQSEALRSSQLSSVAVKTKTKLGSTKATDSLINFQGETSPSGSVSIPSAIESPINLPLGQHVKKVFTCWLIVFGLVGAQMGWVLRPFIGSPDMPFQFFRARESNFFDAVLRMLWNLFA